MNKYDEEIPDGYRQLNVGEMIRDGDIYWSDRWYAASDAMRKFPVEDGWRVARKVDVQPDLLLPVEKID